MAVFTDVTSSGGRELGSRRLMLLSDRGAGRAGAGFRLSGVGGSEHAPGAGGPDQAGRAEEDDGSASRGGASSTLGGVSSAGLIGATTKAMRKAVAGGEGAMRSSVVGTRLFAIPDDGGNEDEEDEEEDEDDGDEAPGDDLELTGLGLLPPSVLANGSEAGDEAAGGFAADSA
jgi:hypothetical protein